MKYIYRKKEIGPTDIFSASGIMPDDVSVRYRDRVTGVTVPYDREIVIERAAPAAPEERAAWDAALIGYGYFFSGEEA